MRKNVKQPHQLRLPLPGAALNCIMVSDEELEERSPSDKTPELLKKAMAGELSAKTLSRHREALLSEAVKKDDADALSLLMPQRRRLDPESFSALFRLAVDAHSPDVAAWLLQYRHAHYTQKDFDRLEQRQIDRELGLLEPDVEELRRIFRLRYRTEGVCICGVRCKQRSYAIPSHIGGKAVCGVNAACFYALDPMPRVTREPSAGDSFNSFGILAEGDIFRFGSSPEKKDSPDSPLFWRVLAKEEGRVLALCERPVAVLPYHPEQQEVTWSDCALRRWLNTVFLPLSFTKEERSRILPNTVTTPANRNFGTPGGEATEDLLFLLSMEEAATLLPNPSSRTLGCWWWLRTPGFDNSFAAAVSPDGIVVVIGSFVDSDDYTVRPALWLRTDTLH